MGRGSGQAAGGGVRRLRARRGYRRVDVVDAQGADGGVARSIAKCGFVEDRRARAMTTEAARRHLNSGTRAVTQSAGSARSGRAGARAKLFDPVGVTARRFPCGRRPAAGRVTCRSRCPTADGSRISCRRTMISRWSSARHAGACLPGIVAFHGSLSTDDGEHRPRHGQPHVLSTGEPAERRRRKCWRGHADQLGPFPLRPRHAARPWRVRTGGYLLAPELARLIISAGYQRGLHHLVDYRAGPGALMQAVGSAGGGHFPCILMLAGITVTTAPIAGHLRFCW